MAVIQCPDCSKDISDKAMACPHCGAVIKKSSNIALTVFLGVIALVLVCGFGVTVWERFSPRKEQTTTDMQQSLDKLDNALKKTK